MEWEVKIGECLHSSLENQLVCLVLLLSHKLEWKLGTCWKLLQTLTNYGICENTSGILIKTTLWKVKVFIRNVESMAECEAIRELVMDTHLEIQNFRLTHDISSWLRKWSLKIASVAPNHPDLPVRLLSLYCPDCPEKSNFSELFSCLWRLKRNIYQNECSIKTF